MKKQIIPSLIAKNQKEFDDRFSKVKSLSNIFHLDVMDGKFVRNKSLMFNFRFPRNYKYRAHLMVKNPEPWIKKNSRKVNSIIFHIKTAKNPESVISLIKSKKRKAGIAINPDTPAKNLTPYLNKVNMVLIMTVNPGGYGAKFLTKTLKKVRELRKLKPLLHIIVDGGINNKTIKSAYQAGANDFVVGSYFQKNEPKDAMKELREAIKA